MNSPAQDNPCPTCTLPCDARTIDGEAGCVTPAPDENRFVAEDGTVYVAVEADYFDCTICAFHNKPCPRGPSCIGKNRTDRRNIVWKREAGK